MLDPGLGTALPCDGGVVPADPGVHLPGQFGEDDVAGQLHHLGVESGVGRHRQVHVVVGDGLLPLGAELLQGGDARRAGVGGGQPGGLRLQERTDREQLVRLLLRGLVDERTLGRAQIDPSLGVEPLQRLTHRLPGHPEVAGQLTLDQMLSGAERPGGDEFEQRLVDALAQRTGPFQLRHSPLRQSCGQHRGPPPGDEQLLIVYSLPSTTPLRDSGSPVRHN